MLRENFQHKMFANEINANYNYSIVLPIVTHYVVATVGWQAHYWWNNLR